MSFVSPPSNINCSNFKNDSTFSQLENGGLFSNLRNESLFKKTNSSLTEFTFKKLMDKSATQLDALEQWVYDFLNLAEGMDAKEFTKANKIIDKLSDKIGFSNAFLLLCRGCQQAYYKQKNCKDYGAQEKISNAVNFFENQLIKVISHNSKNENQLNELQVPLESELFRKEKVNSTFLISLEKKSNVKNTNGLITKIFFGALVVLPLIYKSHEFYKNVGVSIVKDKCLPFNISAYLGENKCDNNIIHENNTLPDGSFFDGQSLNRSKTGYGNYTWQDGSKYIGQFKDNKCEGQGTMLWPDGSFFVGQFKNGEYSYGKLNLSDGSVYEGNFKDGLPEVS
ncbi:MAG: hypothetical protein H0X29_07955 [Parachlamydiaceae bacterium]|nr:hypothetical protein [Parachlamydiaceae bacterium]